jgi:hypothetical protein
MITEPAHSEDDFEVLCSWCGVKIRTDQTEDSYRTCLECFYQSVKDLLDSQRQTHSSLVASDR